MSVLTTNAPLLCHYCHEVDPVVYGGWFAERYLLGRVHRTLPSSASRQIIAAQHLLRRRWPEFEEFAIALKERARGGDGLSQFRHFQSVLHEADVVVMAGSGGVADAFLNFALQLLSFLEVAESHAKPTAMLGQAFGPIRDAHLLERTRTVVPGLQLISLREERMSLPLLRSIGADQSRLLTTGDEAIEMAYEGRHSEAGTGLGVNVRIAQSAGTDGQLLDVLRPTIQGVARSYNARLVSVPIARAADRDARSTREVFRDYADVLDNAESLDTPAKVIERVSECRVVVTGAYHAAVFALSQGIPAVCLVKSNHFVDKFLGLADQFGSGCEVINIAERDFPGRLEQSIQTAWRSADTLRQPLQAAAQRQIQAGRAAYARLRDLPARASRPQGTRLASLGAPMQEL